MRQVVASARSEEVPALVLASYVFSMFDKISDTSKQSCIDILSRILLLVFGGLARPAIFVDAIDYVASSHNLYKRWVAIDIGNCYLGLHRPNTIFYVLSFRWCVMEHRATLGSMYTNTFVSNCNLKRSGSSIYAGTDIARGTLQSTIELKFDKEMNCKPHTRLSNFMKVLLIQ